MHPDDTLQKSIESFWRSLDAGRKSLEDALRRAQASGVGGSGTAAAAASPGAAAADARVAELREIVDALALIQQAQEAASDRERALIARVESLEDQVRELAGALSGLVDAVAAARRPS